MLKTWTQSAYQTSQECLEKFRLAYMEGGHGLKSKAPAQSMWFGTVGHEALAFLYQTIYSEQTLQQVDAIIDTMYKGLTKGTIGTDYQQVEIDKAALKGLMRGYRIVYQKELRGRSVLRFSHQEAELAWKLNLKSNLYTMAGKLDAVAVNRTSGRHYIIERKFPGQLSKNFVDDMEMSPQTPWYLIAYCETFSPGRVGILYDYIRRPGIRQRKGESVQGFIQRVFKESTTRPEFYFYRAFVKKSPQDILVLKQEIINQIHLMEYVASKGLWSKNRKACLARGRCQFLDICAHGQIPQVMAMFDRKKREHEELELKTKGEVHRAAVEKKHAANESIGLYDPDARSSQNR